MPTLPFKLSPRRYPGMPIVIYHATDLVSSGSLAIHTVDSFVIPGGTMGPNGYLMWECAYSSSISDTRNVVVQIGGTNINQTGANSTSVMRFFQQWQNVNSESSQVGGAIGVASGTDYGNGSSGAVTTTVDTSADVTVNIRVDFNVTTGSPIMTINYFIAWVCYLP